MIITTKGNVGIEMIHPMIRPMNKCSKEKNSIIIDTSTYVSRGNDEFILIFKMMMT